MNPVTPLPQPPSREGRVQVLEVLGNAIVGGMESWVLRLVQRLPRERFAFTAICPFESPLTDQLRGAGVEVEIAPMGEDLPWATLQATCALVRERRIELLHAHLPQAHLLAGLAGVLTHTPVLTTIHARQMTTLDLEVHRATRSHVSTVARQSYFHALGLGVEPALLSCEPNGVDTATFRPRERATGEPLRAALGLAPDVPLIGFVGRLSPEKAPQVFVRAALMLKTQMPEARAVFVGEGPMLADLTDMVERYGLQQHVHFAGVRQDMPALYGELDVLVSCSYTEAMPLVLLEAMACGVPAVATRVGGVPDIVEHGRTGWLAAPDNFDEIGRLCAQLLADAPLRRRMGERARERAVQRLDLTPSLARVGALLERLARPQAPQRVGGGTEGRPLGISVGGR